MGWPKKDEGMRLYFERKAKSYLLLTDLKPDYQGNLGGLGELYIDNDPDTPHLCNGMVSPEHIYKKCRRASWSDLPEVWKKAFMDHWFNLEPKESPKDYRGLWRMDELKERGA